MRASECPSGAQLQAFSIGDLPPAEFDRVSEHVVACDVCLSELDTIGRESDDLLSSLRRVPTCDTEATVSVPAPLMRVARAAYRGRDSSESTDLIVDTGRRIARSLTEGPYRLDKFELLAELGVGSFGYVFRAHDTRLDREVAIKVQRAGTLATGEDKERFLREARSAAQLAHPNIVSIYESGQTEDGVCYLVTELIGDSTLEERRQKGRLDPWTSARMVAKIAEALQYAHQHGVVHRDIKPSNILLGSDGEPHIMDFGLAKRDAVDITVTRDGDIMGTPSYMSPEQARGDSRHVDARSDIFSLGVVLYELLTGDRPFHGNGRMLMLQVLEDEPRPPRQLDPHIPRNLETICLKAMAKSPERRYESAKAFADDLHRSMRGEAIRARRQSVAERAWLWCRRNPLPASLLVAITLGSVFGFAYLSSLAQVFVRNTALQSVRMQSEVLEEMNNIYSEVVKRLEPYNVLVSHEFNTDPTVIPLPATLTIEAGKRLSACKTGMQVRLFSDYPFPWRLDGGPRDAFERRALEELRQNPDQPYYEFHESGGGPVLRYASARVLQASCVGCHNNHPASPKTDWKEGDVRGVLEIIRPLEKDIARVHEGLRGAITVVGVVSFVMLGLTIGILIVGNRRRIRRFTCDGDPR